MSGQWKLKNRSSEIYEKCPACRATGGFI